MKNFIYLVQGESRLVQEYLPLANRNNADAIFLTYDEAIKEAFFFPNSTWAQGRNKLLEMARAKGEYLYYIFCDDDIAFQTGGWDEFENYLLALKPAIAVPVFSSKTKDTPIKWLDFQTFLTNDEQLMAFHYEVVRDSIVLPYQNQFDDIHWWASCDIQEVLIQNFYFSSSIQLNKIEVLNECRLRYNDSKIKREASIERVNGWLSEQFIKEYKNTSKLVIQQLVLWRTLCFFLGRYIFSNSSSYHVSEYSIKNILMPESEMLEQYLKHNSKEENF